MDRPTDLYDRATEWGDLLRHVQAKRPRLRLGVVYGRRRFGKSFLLRRLVQQIGGLYHFALEQEERPALERFAASVATLHATPPPLSFPDWDSGMRYLLNELGQRPGSHVVVLDEYPYLQATSKELDSVLQAIIDDAADGAFGDGWQGTVTVILCGSAMSVMTDILSGTSPLRGRAVLDLPLSPFDYREARDFWGIDDSRAAFTLHAVMGGAPGYRDLTSASSPPATADAILDWLGTNVLNPSHALYREDAYLLREDPRVTKQSLYYSILNAIAAGATTPSGIGSRIGKKRTDLDHPFRVLISAGFLEKAEDFLVQRKPTYRVADPIVRFHELITRRNEDLCEERRIQDLWTRAEPTFRSQILGPHFEEIARIWTTKYADDATLGGPIGRPQTLQFNDRRAKRQFELDVVAATRPSASRKKKVFQVIGEAKATTRMRTVADLNRLESIRVDLEKRGESTSRSLRYLLFGLMGFDRGLRHLAATRDDVELVDLDRLYEGT